MAAVHEPHHGGRENVRWQQCMNLIMVVGRMLDGCCGRENVRWQQCMSLIMVVGRMLDGCSA